MDGVEDGKMDRWLEVRWWWAGERLGLHSVAKRKHEVIGRWPDRISFILDVSGTSVEDCRKREKLEAQRPARWPPARRSEPELGQREWTERECQFLTSPERGGALHSVKKNAFAIPAIGDRGWEGTLKSLKTLNWGYPSGNCGLSQQFAPELQNKDQLSRALCPKLATDTCVLAQPLAYLLILSSSVPQCEPTET